MGRLPASDDGEPVASFQPARAKHTTPATGAHAGAEAMLSLTRDTFRLVGAFGQVLFLCCVSEV
jgi:hypothetical protein